MKNDTYYVWRRGDGYVSSTAYDPLASPSKDTFDVLLVTGDWDEARHKVEDERDERHYDLVADWDFFNNRLDS